MIESVTMQGLHIVGFIRKEKLELLSDVYSSKIKTGFCGCVGNKGAICKNLVIESLGSALERRSSCS